MKKVQIQAGGRRAIATEREPVLTNAITPFYTVSQLADLLQLTEMTIYRMISRGALPCYAIGRAKRFSRDDVDKFLEDCRVEGTGHKLTS
jgi:excisionase family DNA binding protein